MCINIQGLFKIKLVWLNIVAVASVVSHEYELNGKELFETYHEFLRKRSFLDHVGCCN